MLVLDRPEPVVVENITIPERMRQVNMAKVAELADSIGMLGLVTPLTVRSINDGEDLVLIAGRHRLEAVKRLGWTNVTARFLDGDDTECRLWEIAENLHRAELTPLEKSEHIAEWVRLTDVKVESQEQIQVDHVEPPEKKVGYKNPPEQKKSGIREASRSLGIDRNEVRRAIKIDGISPEAKQAARDARLDGNQSALLKVAAAPAERQVEVVGEIKAGKPKTETGTDLALIDEFTDFASAVIPVPDIPALIRFIEGVPKEQLIAVLKRISA